MLQSVWYIPAGLDIWNQLLGKYPGRYATMKGMNVPPPTMGPVVWNEDQEPIVEAGTIDERLHSHMVATMSGDVRRSMGCSLVWPPRNRAAETARSDAVPWSDRPAGHRDGPQGPQHRPQGLRARAVVDLAGYIGWERAHGVFYTGVPDMAVGPLYYSLYDAACVDGDRGISRRRQDLEADQSDTADAQQVEDMVRLLMEADAQTVWDQITTHLRNGKSLRSLGDAIQLGAAELVLRTTVPRKFTEGQHPFDYCNTANYWFRTSTIRTSRASSI